MKLYICNALALGMLDRAVQARSITDRATKGMPRVPRPIALDDARAMIARATEIVGAVGHADTARLIAGALELSVERVHGRITVRLRGGPDEEYDRAEMALIGAYVGPRLPEGCTTLPEGAEIDWWVV